MLGPDLWNGSAPQVQSFQSQTGATFPLLLKGGMDPGGNLTALYGPYDNYVVIDQVGVVRYHAALSWPHGNRYHLDEILSAVDTALATSGMPPEDPPDPNDPPGDPGAPAKPGTIGLAPNPFVASTRVQLAGPGSGSWSARVDVLDVSGRRVATLWDGTVSAAVLETQWNGRSELGQTAPSGVYFIRASGTGIESTARVLFVRLVR